MIRLSFFVLLVFLKVSYGIPSYCHNYYSEFALHEEYNKNIDPEINITISEKSFLYNIVEVGKKHSFLPQKMDEFIIYSMKFFLFTVPPDFAPGTQCK